MGRRGARVTLSSSAPQLLCSATLHFNFSRPISYSPTLPRPGFQHKLWKTLLKTARFRAQTFEIRGLLAICTHFVQTCYVHQSPMIYSIGDEHPRFLGNS